MITKETCVMIWNCWNEIENGERLISDMAAIVKEDKERRPPTLHDAFGEKRGLQLGIPSGNDGHRIHDVPIDLGIKIIERHIEDKKKRLEELKAIAKIELNG